MRNLSGNLVRNITAVSGVEEHPIVLFEINHTDLASTVMICNSNCDVISNGNRYIAIPIDFKLPNDDQDAYPAASIIIANIGRELTRWIELSRGAYGASVTYKIIERSNPDYVEFESSAEVIGITMNNKTVTLNISYDYILGKRAVPKRYDKQEAPGLF